MNKEKFIKEMSKRLNIEEKYAEDINQILEDNFLIGKKNKDKIIESIQTKLEVDEEKADTIYETSLDIIKDSLKEKIKEPFKSLD